MPLDVKFSALPKQVCLKLLKAIITTVTLSKVLLNNEFLRIYSTPAPHYLWMLLAKFICLLSLTEFHTQAIVSWFDNLSKIPSQPRTMKSCSFVILVLILGLEVTGSIRLDSNNSSDYETVNLKQHAKFRMHVFVFVWILKAQIETVSSEGPLIFSKTESLWVVGGIRSFWL